MGCADGEGDGLDDGCILTLGIKLGEGEGYEEGMTDVVGAGVDLLLLLLFL